MALVDYLRGNRDFLKDTISREIPGVKIEAPIEATYLSWLNVAALDLANPVKFFEAAGVGLSDGVPSAPLPAPMSGSTSGARGPRSRRPSHG